MDNRDTMIIEPKLLSELRAASSSPVVDIELYENGHLVPAFVDADGHIHVGYYFGTRRFPSPPKAPIPLWEMPADPARRARQEARERATVRPARVK